MSTTIIDTENVITELNMHHVRMTAEVMRYQDKCSIIKQQIAQLTADLEHTESLIDSTRTAIYMSRIALLDNQQPLEALDICLDQLSTTLL